MSSRLNLSGTVKIDGEVIYYGNGDSLGKGSADYG